MDDFQPARKPIMMITWLSGSKDTQAHSYPATSDGPGKIALSQFQSA
jgi:hypothetical protein